MAEADLSEAGDVVGSTDLEEGHQKRNKKSLWATNEFHNSMPLSLNLIRPCVRKSRERKKNIADDVPSPPPSSSDDDIFEPVKRMK